MLVVFDDRHYDVDAQANSLTDWLARLATFLLLLRGYLEVLGQSVQYFWPSEVYDLQYAGDRCKLGSR